MMYADMMIPWWPWWYSKPWWLPQPGRSLGAAFGWCATFTATGLPIDHWQSSCEPTCECLDVPWIWMSFTKHMNFLPVHDTSWCNFSSYDMSIFGEFSWHPGNPFQDLKQWSCKTPRLEAKSENTTLALDRAIAGFLVRSSFNISYLVPWKRWIHWKFHMILCGVMAFLMAMVIPTVVSMVILGRQYSFVDVWNRTSWIFLTSVCQATKVK